MRDAFVHNEDIHTKTASEVFKMHPDFVTPLMRSRAKAVNFGIVYGIGDYSLSEDLKISVSEARSYIKNYLETYHGVSEYMEKTVSKAKETGYVKTAFNRIRYIPELSAANKNVVAFGERVARNTPIQGTAADIIKIAMIKVSKRFEKENMQSRLILQIHDELIVEAPESEAKRAEEIMRKEMETAARLSVPLLVDISSGKSWFDAK
jgi:DNA polymerase-1